MSVFEILNEKTKDFNMEEWIDQDSSCINCNASIRLAAEHEWPDDPRTLLCSSCSHEILSKALEEIDELRKENSLLKFPGIKTDASNQHLNIDLKT